ncbi:MAG: hypothetical protein AAGU75_22600 [Bacillota bacterium]|jgi:predicted RND superfamily exporter protein
MNAQKKGEQEIEKLYFTYLEEAKRVREVYLHAYLPFMWVGLAVMAISITAIVIGFTSLGKMGYAEMKTLSCTFWIGLPVAFVIAIIGLATAKKRANEVLAEVDPAMIGFQEFYDLHFSKRYWPKEMVSGKKLERFLSIINRKEYF